MAVAHSLLAQHCALDIGDATSANPTTTRVSRPPGAGILKTVGCPTVLKFKKCFPSKPTVLDKTGSHRQGAPADHAGVTGVRPAQAYSPCDEKWYVCIAASLC